MAGRSNQSSLGRGRTAGLWAVALAGGLFVAGSAWADGPLIDKNAGSTVTLDVTGHVAQKCTVGAIGSAAVGDLMKPGVTASRKLGLSCNVPFNLDVKATNGGMTNGAYPAKTGAYPGWLGYTLTLTVPVRDPQSRTITQSYTGLQLVGAGQTLSSGGAIAIDGAQADLALDKPTKNDLHAGQYSETIEFVVAIAG